MATKDLCFVKYDEEGKGKFISVVTFRDNYNFIRGKASAVSVIYILSTMPWIKFIPIFFPKNNAINNKNELSVDYLFINNKNELSAEDSLE